MNSMSPITSAKLLSDITHSGWSLNSMDSEQILLQVTLISFCVCYLHDAAFHCCFFCLGTGIVEEEFYFPRIGTFNPSRICISCLSLCNSSVGSTRPSTATTAASTVLRHCWNTRLCRFQHALPQPFLRFSKPDVCPGCFASGSIACQSKGKSSVLFASIEAIGSICHFSNLPGCCRLTLSTYQSSVPLAFPWQRSGQRHRLKQVVSRRETK